MLVSIIGGGGKTTLLYEMAGFCVKKRSEGTGDNFDAHLSSAEGMA